MEQTPVHDKHNPTLLQFLPVDARRVVEVGCSSGALAREYKKINPACIYTGVEIVPEYAELARRYCDSVVVTDIEDVDGAQFAERFEADCWVFGDSLEHLRDPWGLLAKIRRVIPPDGSVVACIPNAQHWSVQARLSRGDFRYEEKGLLDRSHLRWFTRKTIVEMFNNANFKIVGGTERVKDPEPQRDTVLPLIRALAAGAGGDPELAVKEAIPYQYVIRAVPRAS
jgi:SAM-dependent methyltransferase